MTHEVRSSGGERALMIGFLLGVAAFLAGNGVGVHLIAWR